MTMTAERAREMLLNCSIAQRFVYLPETERNDRQVNVCQVEEDQTESNVIFHA